MRIAEFYLFSLSLKVDILSLLCGPTAAGIVASKILVNFSSLWLLADFHCPWVSVKSIHWPSLTVPAITNVCKLYSCLYVKLLWKHIYMFCCNGSAHRFTYLQASVHCVVL